MFDPPQHPEPKSSYQAMLQSPQGIPRRTDVKRPNLETPSSSSHEPGWDMVDDLPLRWATDYVPLAVPGSRLMNASVLTYALWRNDDTPRGIALLAVGIKSAVLLYESPKGERAFRFIKVRYTPQVEVTNSQRRSAPPLLGILHASSPSRHHVCLPKRPGEPFSKYFGCHQHPASRVTSSTRTRISS